MRKIIKGLHQFQTSYFSSHRDMFEQLAQWSYKGAVASGSATPD